MTLEFWTAFGSIGTLVVIAVTAIIAAIQVRHMRAANQVQFLHSLFAEYDGPELREAFRFVRFDLPARLEDPSYRAELRTGAPDRDKHPEALVLDFFAGLGHIYASDAIDRTAFLRAFAHVIVSFWARLEPVIALLQDPVGGNVVFAQFEILTLDARRWLKRYPHGMVRKGQERMTLVDKWRDVDARTTR